MIILEKNLINYSKLKRVEVEIKNLLKQKSGIEIG